jgi:hypothetical protein
MKGIMTQSDCEERSGRGNLIHPLRHCEERSDVAISSLKYFKKKGKNKKMRSSRPQKTMAQDEAFINRSCLFRIAGIINGEEFQYA